MLFNSFEFALFLPIIFCFYWLLQKSSLKAQNILLVVASYIFYGWWDWRFLLLMAFSSTLDYTVGLGLATEGKDKRRKALLWVSIVTNLGLLGFFKYFNFFAENFYQVFTLFGKPIFDPFTLNIILPVGISFYTFQTLSYSIDVYKRKLKPTEDIIAFFAFVSFFPQLVAGPIERATNLLPQFLKKRSFDCKSSVDGLRQILWGLFKKVVVADTCAVQVNEIFANIESSSGSTLLLGLLFFSFQIYGDFSGYSDIAIGVSRLFGFNMNRNFALPYFSRDIAEFWRRWHISLSTWFRDYLYIPLGGSRGSISLKVRNTILIFLVSGFWHGANWTFIIWGLIHALCFLPLIISTKNRNHTNVVAEGRFLPSSKESVQLCTTFLIIMFSWVFFRARSVTEALTYLSGIFQASLFSRPDITGVNPLLWILILLTIEWIQRTKLHGLSFEDTKLPTVFRWSIYYILVIAIWYYRGDQQTFIYFQF